MPRALVLLLAVVGLILAAAGAFVILAVGIPAVGLNEYGHNPKSSTLSGLTTGAVLYLVGAALLVSAIRWMREHGRGSPARAIAFLAVIALVWSLLMGARGNWIGIAELVLFAVAILTPMALGFRLKA
jgi:hypothetical protein